MLRRFRRKNNSSLQSQPLISEDDVDTVEPLSLTVLKGGSQNVERLKFIPGYDLLLTCTHRENFVFDTNPVALLYYSIGAGGGGGAWKRDNVHICDDVVASIRFLVAGKFKGSRLEVSTWRTSTNRTRILATLSLHKFEQRGNDLPVRCMKLNEEQFIAANNDGHCCVIEHLRGAKLNLVHHFDFEDLLDMDVHGNLLFLLSSFSVTVLDINSSFEELHEFFPSRTSGCCQLISVSASRVCIGCEDGELHAYRNKSGFPRIFILDAKVGKIVSIHILSDNDVACVGLSGFISFVSITCKKVRYILNFWKTDNFHQLCSAIVLGDGRIAVGGNDGFCATFKVPPPLNAIVQECAARLYPSSVAGQRLYPFRSSWLLLQQSIVSTAEACRKMASIENGPSSLDEWVFGHNLLMKAVNEGVVPASADFDGKQYFWLRVLYKYCPDLAMGEHDLSMVLCMLREAQNPGVINEVETIIHSIETRRHTMEKIVEGQRLMFNAVYELFMHLAEQDVVLQELLQWKRVQQLTGLVNALLACVPFCGALVTNAVAATATVLNDINLHDLADALLGVGKEISGGLATDIMVGLFVKRSNVLLSEGEWEKIPERQRKYVEAAATALGMSIEELRRQLLKAASNDIMDDDDSLPDTNVTIEDLEDLKNRPNEKESSDSFQIPLTLPIEETPPETEQNSSQIESKIDLSSLTMANEGICNKPLGLVMTLNEEVKKMREEYARKEERSIGLITRMMRRIDKLEENEKASQTLESKLMSEISKLKKELSELKEQQKNWYLLNVPSHCAR